MLTPELDLFIERMPKVELHLHLEGTIQPKTLLELAQHNQVEIPARDVAGVEQLFRYHNFGEFLTVYMALARAIVSGEDFERLAYESGMMLAHQHVLYAEVMLSPMQHLLRGMNMVEAIEGTVAGFRRVERETGLVVRLGLDYGRQYGPDQAWPVLEIAQQAMTAGVVAWSIGGNEIGHPPEPFAEVFGAARAAGLHVMAHAGEVVGPASVWGAVDVLHVERLGHGIRSIEDPALVAYLRERRVVLDICPTSNMRTGAVASWDVHPLRQLFDAGVLVTLNSDDPTFFHTTLTDEYRKVVCFFDFTVDELCTLVLNGVRASFLPDQERAALLHQIEAELIALRGELGV